MRRLDRNVCPRLGPYTAVPVERFCRRHGAQAVLKSNENFETGAALQRPYIQFGMIDDAAPITLKAACKLWPGARLTVSTLRAEAGRGRLDIFRIGRRDYTTAQAMREMVNRCRAEDSRRVSTSIRSAANGPSETARISSARAALLARLPKRNAS